MIHFKEYERITVYRFHLYCALCNFDLTNCYKYRVSCITFTRFEVFTAKMYNVVFYRKKVRANPTKNLLTAYNDKQFHNPEYQHPKNTCCSYSYSSSYSRRRFPISFSTSSTFLSSYISRNICLKGIDILSEFHRIQSRNRDSKDIANG
jgi:hypothetical protein